MSIIYLAIFVWLTVTNVTGFMLMAKDKAESKKKRPQRISEKTLLKWALLGGVAGVYGGMEYCRHKTKHQDFRMKLWLIFTLYLTAAVLIIGIIITH
ncbi:DUF1294 domain-containing protein [candidate division WWE3 bacterium]|uniref:DUF1294 domain-containing protein n=1 Tax=candidate division WWE3 bacterium TaxID=2053526 RepID=A0A955LG24_UNCKA|nr:DUF1294 domain-containing protein [candidate division WWE3 bacterium]